MCAGVYCLEVVRSVLNTIALDVACRGGYEYVVFANFLSCIEKELAHSQGSPLCHTEQ